MRGTYAAPLVALSILIAIGASYTALTLAARVAAARGRARLAWLLGGSVAMGSGIWSMHFVAMLAFHLPIEISYDMPLVVVSWLAAVAGSVLALYVASRTRVSHKRLCAAGVIIGIAIVAMHYTGMAAVRVPARLSYDPLLVAASVLIAITASTVALYLFLWLRTDASFRPAAAVVMGLAIAGMHYTAMAAAHFSEPSSGLQPHDRHLLGAPGLLLPVVATTVVIFALTLMGAKLTATEALRESEERYRSVVSEIDEVIFRTDAAGRWTFLNPAWTQITGFAPEESLGAPMIESLHPDDRAGGVAEGRREVRCLTKDNGARWVEVHARLTRGPSDELIGMAGVIRDVSERRRAEEALRAARQTAEAASHAKSEFLSRMSHELRTPLNAILGFGQLIELEATTSGQRESADHILKAGRHLLALINEVLDITGIESGVLHLSAEPVAVADVVRETLDLIGPLAATRQIALSADSPNIAGRHVHADRQRLKQVLLNLMANAVKYNRDGGRAHVTSEPAPNGRLRLVVSDTGPGIPPDKIGRLFTAFDRLGAEGTGVEGTGLGLALCKRLSEAMGGTIGVASTVGVGSMFWVELPAAVSPTAALDDGALAAMAKPPQATNGQRPSRTILYVEDNLSNLSLVQRILAHRPDVELIPSMQGGLALELARLHRPDLVLLDLHLPDIPGEEVLNQLRQAPDCRQIPVVVLSADATPSQIDRLMGAGAHAYVTKPLDVKPFMAIVNEVLA
ncbi:MAG TPA: MHYT domain-containing protein [Gemmatimonadaceae bacterium]|jgi:PAS domain S-box-containing protein|nr:MHYT domain-containing protein [Gemmatimonadaceae bacterium]